MPSAFAPPRREFQQYGGRRHSDRWLSERHAFSLLRSVLALRGFVIGRDNIGADDDPADNGPLRYIARGARVLTADDEANPDALALYDGALGHATGEQHSINIDATSARIGFCNFSGLSRFAAVALTSSSQVSIAD